MGTPGAAEETPPGTQAQHAQPATKHEDALGPGLTHPEGEHRATGLGHITCEDDDGCSATLTEGDLYLLMNEQLKMEISPFL